MQRRSVESGVSVIIRRDSGEFRYFSVPRYLGCMYVPTVLRKVAALFSPTGNNSMSARDNELAIQK